MSFPIELTQEQYEALVALARAGTRYDDQQVDVDKARRLETFLKDLESCNGITRYFVWVRWQEMGAELRGINTNVDFPAEWPPQWQYSIESVNTAITRQAVEDLVEREGIRPTNIMVTRDPGGELGWQDLDSFFIQ